jgi:hypothetical protein
LYSMHARSPLLTAANRCKQLYAGRSSNRFKDTRAAGKVQLPRTNESQRRTLTASLSHHYQYMSDMSQKPYLTTIFTSSLTNARTITTTIIMHQQHITYIPKHHQHTTNTTPTLPTHQHNTTQTHHHIPPPPTDLGMRNGAPAGRATVYVSQQYLYTEQNTHTLFGGGWFTITSSFLLALCSTRFWYLSPLNFFCCERSSLGETYAWF